MQGKFHEIKAFGSNPNRTTRFQNKIMKYSRKDFYSTSETNFKIPFTAIVKKINCFSKVVLIISGVIPNKVFRKEKQSGCFIRRIECSFNL